MPEIEVVRHAQARRAKLSVDPASGRTRLVLPPRASLKTALKWAETQRAWIERQHERLPYAVPFVDGAQIPFDDALLTIVCDAAASRRIVRMEDRLIVGGPAETLSRRVEAWLKREALRLLSADTADYALLAGVTVTRVAVGDPRGRWGSCAASGAIRYSWRLALAPRAVRRATAAHEVAHRIHMNHGAAFHTLVAELFGSDPTPHRCWLKANGAQLHWFGRSSSSSAGGSLGR